MKKKYYKDNYKFTRLRWDLDEQRVWLEGSNDQFHNETVWSMSHPEMHSELFEILIENLAGMFMDSNQNNLAELPPGATLH
jgi:hypothetical protein